MKKSLIWILTAIMAITFGALLYFQIMYLENMVKMRREQFSENVMRSIHSTVGMLERRETLSFLEEDATLLSSGDDEQFDDSSVNVLTEAAVNAVRTKITYPSPTQPVAERYRNLQIALRNQYQYQKGLLNEVILNILREAPTRPMLQRADSAEIRKDLRAELNANGVEVPFVFAVSDKSDQIVYQTQGFEGSDTDIPTYSAILFPNLGANYKLIVQFPTRDTYIFSSVRFLILTLAFTAILLVIFLYTVILIFRQKKLTEMKTDFINNMTHEFKTPISTISLAAQMLADDSVRKSPSSLKHLSTVIGEEAERLRFQVEKVLQMSMYDDAGGSALKFSEVDVNSIVEKVVNTQKIKAEKYGGVIEMNLEATNPYVRLDEMHFTNVIFNLLDNALKYMKEDTEPHLQISTRDTSDKMLEIKIRDNGIGIKKEDLKRIFEKFYRVSTGNRHDVKGFGLGLAYVKKMVNIFGGTISAESEFGKWSEFIIRLPLAEPDDDFADEPDYNEGEPTDENR